MPDLVRRHITSVAERKRRAWIPTDSIDESTGRASGTTVSLTSGQMRLIGNLFVPAGATVTTATLVSGSQAAVTPTNQWVALVQVSDRSVLALSADETNAAWGANTAKTFTFGTPHTATVDTAVYIGIVVVAGTPNNLQGTAFTTTTTIVDPRTGGTSTGSLTDPASLVGAPSAPPGESGRPYCYIA